MPIFYGCQNSYLCNKLRKGHFFRTSGKIAKRAQRVSQRTRVTEKMHFRNELHITFCVMMKKTRKTASKSRTQEIESVRKKFKRLSTSTFSLMFKNFICCRHLVQDSRTSRSAEKSQKRTSWAAAI